MSLRGDRRPFLTLFRKNCVSLSVCCSLCLTQAERMIQEIARNQGNVELLSPVFCWFNTYAQKSVSNKIGKTPAFAEIYYRCQDFVGNFQKNSLLVSYIWVSLLIVGQLATQKTSGFFVCFVSCLMRWNQDTGCNLEMWPATLKHFFLGYSHRWWLDGGSF